jgi:hypothetical protein
MAEKSSTAKTNFPSSESDGSRVGVVSENLTLQIRPIKLDGSIYLAWSWSYMLFIKALGLYGYLMQDKRDFYSIHQNCLIFKKIGYKY